MASTSKEECIETDVKKRKKVEDINRKMMMVYNILNVTCDEKLIDSLSVPLENLHDRVALYTALDPYVIYQGKKAMKPLRNMLNMSEHQGALSTMKSMALYEELRAIIIDLYVYRRVTPTVDQILYMLTVSRCDTKNPIDTNDKLLCEMKKAGFVWRRIPGTDRCIIAEKPEWVYKRQVYLRQIAKYRAEGRFFVYIDEVGFFRQGLNSDYDHYALPIDTTAHYAAIYANRNGFMSFYFDSSLNDKDLNRFLLDFIIPELPASTVLVINEKKHHASSSEPITEYSTKSEMSEWLARNDIPHSRDIHKADMFKLIQSYKGRVDNNVHPIKDIVSTHGHDVIFVPHGSNMLNYFKDFIEELNKMSTTIPFKEEMINLKDQYGDEHWREFEDNLISTEKKMFKEDLQLETIIDKLLMQGTDGKIAKEHLMAMSIYDKNMYKEDMLLDIVQF